jgi:hypothetical protein
MVVAESSPLNGRAKTPWWHSSTPYSHRHSCVSHCSYQDDTANELGTRRSPDCRRSSFGAIVLLLSALLFVEQIIVSPDQPTLRGDWESFRNDYHRKYQRNPPDTMKQWLNFATRNKCEATNLYDAIERDLAVFRQSDINMNQVIHEATTFTNYSAACALENNVLSFNIQQTIFDNNFWEREIASKEIERVLRWVLQPLVDHKPPIKSKFVFNLRDEPTEKHDAKYPIFSMCHVSNLNDDVNRSYELSREQSSNNTISRDILVPYFFSMSIFGRGLWFWPFYSTGKAWCKRKDTIVWRGSTTGVWEDGPRFRLLEKYGGSRVHRIAPNISVNADFAFVRVVQNEGRDLNIEKYRRAEKLTYRQLQNHKYVLDVDGNCKRIPIDCCLSRSSLSHSLIILPPCDSLYRTLSEATTIWFTSLQSYQVSRVVQRACAALGGLRPGEL